ncbi:hypothetical protein [Sphingomonas sp.]|uniref:hypothetical protein n=1 Tax=Sphingomonas sp. TaxID=28214 RepID=UPI001B1387D2|nr:hypothetical protein [Sphingomonas sp.]MBO9711955.1 hypothetical protein [Sphingomonas sp.]
MRSLVAVPAAILLASAGPLPSAPGVSIAALVAAHLCGDDSTAEERPAILPGYGAGGFAVRTVHPEAQAFFTNGMQLAHAFAHKASIAAFGEARRRDPNCAMCAWGEAWASGPTINYGIEPDVQKKLAETAAEAQKLAAGGPQLEQDLTAALVLRYVGKPGEGNRAFADAMDRLAAKYTGEDAIQVIAADALMVAAGDSWDAVSMAHPVALLEAVLKRNPDYTPAIHFYIHATEGAGYPKRAEPYADRLAILAPAASHLVHMPSHTYYWIGRYQDAANSNVRAVAIGLENAKRLKLTGEDGVWQLTYHAHNVHFGLGGALMSGDGPAALALARPVVAMAGRTGELDPFRQVVLGESYVALARFAPNELLALADPGPKNQGAQALWHYARAEAHAALGDVEGTRREGRLIARLPGDSLFKLGAPLSKVARLTIAGRLAMLKGKPARAAELFGRAAAIEEAKPLSTFSDPPIWWYPVRRDLAAALLAEGKAAEALTAIDESLAYRPNDPVALTIRAQVQAKLGDAKAARSDGAAARRGWVGSTASLNRLAG